jgi:hypothetical protein
MEKLTHKQILRGFNRLTALDNGVNENREGRYQVFKARKMIKDDGEFLQKEEIKINEKYFEKNKETGQFADLKKGMKQEDYNKEIEDFHNEEKEVEIYKIKLSKIEDAKIITIFQKEIPWPGEYMDVLEPWLIFDHREEEEGKEVPKPKLVEKEKSNANKRLQT